jgi:hypothetical protein
VGQIVGQYFDSAPGQFDARSGSFDGPWTGIASDDVSVMLNEANATEAQFSVSDTISVSVSDSASTRPVTVATDSLSVSIADSVSALQSYLSRTDTISVSLSESTSITAQRTVVEQLALALAESTGNVSDLTVSADLDVRVRDGASRRADMSIVGFSDVIWVDVPGGT